MVVEKRSCTGLQGASQTAIATRSGFFEVPFRRMFYWTSTGSMGCTLVAVHRTGFIIWLCRAVPVLLSRVFPDAVFNLPPWRGLPPSFHNLWERRISLSRTSIRPACRRLGIVLSFRSAHCALAWVVRGHRYRAGSGLV
jgi:hypothetical protein